MEPTRLFDLPLGTKFKYPNGDKVFVFLSYQYCGLVCDHIPVGDSSRILQGVYSAAISRYEFEQLMVSPVE